MKNLEVFVKAVWNATTPATKREAMVELINNSHAKAETKRKALEQVDRLSMGKMDKFAVNYMMSGEGLSV